MNKVISQSCIFRILIISATSLGANITGAEKRGGPSGSSRAVRSTTSCILPPYPEHGTYEVINAKDTEPGQSREAFVLSVSCHQGYGIEDSNTPHHYVNSTLVYCIQGLWPQTMPKCVHRVSLNLMRYPVGEVIRYDGEDVVLQCRDEGPLRAKVEWRRERGLIKNGSVNLHGRLEMLQVTHHDSGIYVCEAKDYAGHPGAQVRVSITIRESPCLRNEVACDNVRCISKTAVCDYKMDCADGSDEKYCPPAIRCELNEFTCKNSKCILKTWVCDSEDDCGDNSDEQNCNVQVNV